MSLNDADRPLQPMRVINRRFLDRAIHDLPDDLDLDAEDVLGVLRAYVRISPQTVRDDGGNQDQRPPWARSARFGLPGSPKSSRVTSPHGERSFHLAKNETVSRTAASFDRYAKDKVATLQVGERGINHEPALSAAARDEYMRDHGGEAPDARPAFSTSLDSDDDIRAAQWNEIEVFERAQRVNPDGRPPKVSIYYERDPAFFDRAAAAAECPGGLRKHIERARRRFERGKPPGKRSAQLGVGWENDEARQVFEWLKGLPGWRGENGEGHLARCSEGRGTQTVLAMEGEYCAEFDHAARDRIRAGVYAFFQRQRNPGDNPNDTSVIALMIADHLPDSLNDRRNVHFHLQAAVRRVTVEDGRLRFADRKVDAMTRDTFIPLLRAEFARLSNIELAAIGADYRLHPGTLKQMGCHEEMPQIKLHRWDTLLERASVPTERGWSNDLEAWQRIMRAADRDYQHRLAAITVRMAEIRSINRASPASDRAEQELREAARLRHEARRIETMIDMARSRPERTAQFAPAYADKSPSRNAAGWSARADEAIAWLNCLDRELELERSEIDSRMALAAQREAAANAVITGLNIEPAPALAPPQDPHRAATVIATAPLYITRTRGRLFVDPIDDPHDLVAGIDLRTVQRRLAVAYQAQQRELAQIAAFVARHGGGASPVDALKRPSPWLERNWQRWHGTAAFDRVVANPVGANVLDKNAAGGEGSAFDTFPSLVDLPILGGGTPQSANRPARKLDMPAKPATPSAAARQPAQSTVVRTMIWTDDEDRHSRVARLSVTKDRNRIAEDLDRALAARSGNGAGVTPFTALLLRRIYKGFDPETVSAVSDGGSLTYDQQQAGEIMALSRTPAFAQLEARARAGDPSLRREIDEPVSPTAPYRHGQVRIVDDIVRYDPARYAHGEIHRPEELIKPAMARLEAGEILLTRYGGLTGVFDPAVRELTRHNYIPLLYPAYQVRLEVVRRIQQEERHAILTEIATGDLSVEAKLEVNPKSGVTTARVAVTNESDRRRSLVDRLNADPEFYFDCRRAQMGVGPNAALRHPDALMRAYLTACVEKADEAILTLLRRRMQKVRTKIDLASLSTKDRHIITAAAKSVTATPRPTYSPSRRRGSAHQPGSDRR